MPDRSVLQKRIMNLDDGPAVRALGLVAEHEYREEVALVAAAWEDVGPRLHDALADSALDDYLSSPRASASDGELARVTLVYLADTSAAMADIVDRALTYATRPSERLDPATLAVGGLVLVVLQTEVKLERQPNGRWQLLFHKRPMSDSTLGHVLTALIGRFTGGPK